MPSPKRTPCPERIKPQLLTMASRPPAGDGWIIESKMDGYRMLARIDAGVKLFTKNGFDWTKRMPRLVRDLELLPVRSAWIDGEVVIQAQDGRPIFQSLQIAFSSGKTEQITYFAFDLMYLNGVNLRARPVELRRRMLSDLLDQCSLENVRFSQAFDVDPNHLLHAIREMQMEGLVCKRIGSPYTGERDGSWVKVKCSPRQEFIIVGFTRAAAGIGSLLIGLHDDTGKLVYAGRVRSGLTDRSLRLLKSKLKALEQPETPLQVTPELAKGITVAWVAPLIVCEVKYTEITPNGRLRHAVFLGIREDKPASEITLETAHDTP
ncbi:non-homologous end-joining DNA ligase [Pseudomonas fluorescens]|uniref:DNA ligase (ATP) n=1 Tax=Pseudomonas fluorescens TaxID=294 RepID=A0A5E7N394_PSEFL|nr:non-homologous end-joining DNA ligase [Pseudomonas fluorescens]VVP31369.1 Multifunctional non-homologous end joining protein LigD [Pseudomonas fluorescens]